MALLAEKRQAAEAEGRAQDGGRARRRQREAAAAKGRRSGAARRRQGRGQAAARRRRERREGRRAAKKAAAFIARSQPRRQARDRPHHEAAAGSDRRATAEASPRGRGDPRHRRRTCAAGHGRPDHRHRPRRRRARPARSTGTGDGPPPLILMAPEPRGQPGAGPRRARARPAAARSGRAATRAAPSAARRHARPRPRRLPPGSRRRASCPTDRRAKAEWIVPPGEDGGAEPGEIVLAEPLPHHRPRPEAGPRDRAAGPHGRRALGQPDLHPHPRHPARFPRSRARRSRARRAASPLGRRTDLRDMPLVTIDGEDARDFDDAVFAEPDGDGLPPDRRDRRRRALRAPRLGARPRGAATRGNSVYFPDRVVPMLPEALSNGWCSLRPSEDRGCLFVEMRIDADGPQDGHRFGRGLMRSAARLTYEQVQAAARRAATISACPAARTLYAAFRALLAARTRARHARPRPAGAPGRARRRRPRAQRRAAPAPRQPPADRGVHGAGQRRRRRGTGAPAPALHVPRPRPAVGREARRRCATSCTGSASRCRRATRCIRATSTACCAASPAPPEAPLVNEVMLRSQSQAAYSPDNIGHFGLALPRYAHFTSPIRRYADLLVHRALIRGLRLGDGRARGRTRPARFAETAEHITATERRAALAERDAIDRYLAAFMADKVGATFRGAHFRRDAIRTFRHSRATAARAESCLSRRCRTISGCTTNGTQTLTGRRTRLAFRLAQEVEVRLAEASPVTGGLVFHILQGVPSGARDRAGAEGQGPALAPPRASPWNPRRGSGTAAPAGSCCCLLALLLLHAQALPAADAASTRISPATSTPPRSPSWRRARWIRCRSRQLAIWGLRGLTALDPDADARAARRQPAAGLAGTASCSRSRRPPAATRRLGRCGGGDVRRRHGATRRRCAEAGTQGIVTASSTSCSTISTRIRATSHPPRRSARIASAAPARPGSASRWRGTVPYR